MRFKGLIIMAFALIVALCFFGCAKEDKNEELKATETTKESLHEVPSESVYDKDNRPLTVVSKDDEGRVVSYTEYEYDGGLLMRQTIYDGYGVMASYRIFKYNDKGLCVKEEEYDPLDNLCGYSTYEYNSRGAIHRIYSAEGKLISVLEDYSEETG